MKNQAKTRTNFRESLHVPLSLRMSSDWGWRRVRLVYSGTLYLSSFLLQQIYQDVDLCVPLSQQLFQLVQLLLRLKSVLSSEVMVGAGFRLS